MSTVQGWIRAGNGPWSKVAGMTGDPRELHAKVQQANSASDDTQVALFTTGHDPNSN